MKAENILRAIKNILDRDIARLNEKVLDPEEDTLINGLLSEAKAIRQSISNYEKMPDWYGVRNDRV